MPEFVLLNEVHSRVPNGIEVERRVPGEVSVGAFEAKSSKTRVAPSPGIQRGSNGIMGRGSNSRINPPPYQTAG